MLKVQLYQISRRWRGGPFGRNHQQGPVVMLLLAQIPRLQQRHQPTADRILAAHRQRAEMAAAVGLDGSVARPRQHFGDPGAPHRERQRGDTFQHDLRRVRRDGWGAVFDLGGGRRIRRQAAPRLIRRFIAGGETGIGAGGLLFGAGGGQGADGRGDLRAAASTVARLPTLNSRLPVRLSATR